MAVYNEEGFSVFAAIISMLFSFSAAHAQISGLTSTNFPMACDDPYIKAKRCVQQKGENQCQSEAAACVQGCVPPTNWTFEEVKRANLYTTQCTPWAGAATPVDPAPIKACTDAVSALRACKSDCEGVYNSCVSTCQSLPTAVERTEALKKCSANKPPAEKVPVDPAGEDDKPKEPIPPVTDDDPAEDTVDPEENTGDPNVISQQPALQGIGNTPYGDTDIGSTDARAINFATGPGPERNGFQSLGNGAGVNPAFAGTGHSNNAEFEGEVMLGGKDNNPVGANGGGGGGGGLPMSAGGGGGGAPPNGSPAAAGRRSGGGAYRNAAGDYLSRHSPFSYQSSGAERAAAGSSKRGVATKKNYGPKYVKKGNDGKDALHRLFGAGLTPASQRRNPYSCAGSVFCPVETFYNKIERYPNHEINPDSY